MDVQRSLRYNYQVAGLITLLPFLSWDWQWSKAAGYGMETLTGVIRHKHDQGGTIAGG